MSDEEAAFWTAIELAPNDPTPRLVFSDWLEERGDPRGIWLRDDRLSPLVKRNGRHPADELIEMLSDGEETKAGDLLLRLGKDAIQPLLYALRHASRYEREMIRAVLTRLSSELEAIRPQLELDLKSSDPGVLLAASIAMGCISAPDVIQVAINQIASDSSANWADTFDSLRLLGPAAAPAVPSIIRRWQAEESAASGVAFRNAACDAIRAIGPAAIAAAPLLARTLNHPRLGRQASNALAAMGNEAIPSILPLLNSSDRTTSRLAASALLQASSDPERLFVDVLTDKTTTMPARVSMLEHAGSMSVQLLPLIVENLRNEDTRIACAAAEGLSRFGEQAAPALGALEGVLRETLSGELRKAIIVALAEIDPSGETTRTVRVLGLGDTEDQVAQAAYETIVERSEYPQLIERLCELVHYTQISTRIINYLTDLLASHTSQDHNLRSAGEKAADQLAQCLSFPILEIRVAAAKSLEKHVTQQLIPKVGHPLIAATVDQSEVVREYAFLAIAKLGVYSRTACRRARKALQDQHRAVVVAAIKSLAPMRAFRSDIDRWLLPLLGAKSKKLRASAAEALTAGNGPHIDCSAHAAQLLRDDSPEVRAAGLKLLAFSKDETYRQRLEKAIAKALHDEVVVRHAAVRLVIELSIGEKYLDQLLVLFQTESNDEVLNDIERALKGCRFEPIRMIPVLEDPSSSVRARGLALLDPENLVSIMPVIVAELQRHDPVTVKPAIGALAKIGPAALPSLDIVARYLEDEEFDWHTGEYFSSIGAGAASVVPAIIDRYEARRSDSLLLAMVKLTTVCPEVVPTVRAALERYVDDSMLVFSLRELGEAAVVYLPQLVQLLDKRIDVRCVAGVIGRIGPGADAAIPILHQLLEETVDLRSLSSVIGGLSGIGPAAAVAVPAIDRVMLNPNLGGQSAQVRVQAVVAFGRIGSSEGLQGVARGLFDEDGYVRAGAAQSLIELGTKGVRLLPEVIRALSMRDWDRVPDGMRAKGFDHRLLLLEFVQGISAFDSSTLTVLEKLLSDGNEFIRFRSAEILLSIGAVAKKIRHRHRRHRDEAIRELFEND